MRHQSATRHFNRDTKARKGLILSLVSNLALQGEIIVTKPMAKEAARHFDKLISRAAKGDLASRRVIQAFFGKRAMTNLLVDQLAPALTEGGRQSGFTTISYYGQRRGDNAELYTLKFVKEVPTRIVKAEDKTKFAKAAKKSPVTVAKKETTKKPAVKKAATKAKKKQDK